MHLELGRYLELYWEKIRNQWKYRI